MGVNGASADPLRRAARAPPPGGLYLPRLCTPSVVAPGEAG